VTSPLGLPFATEAEARRIAATLEEPEWLLDERLDAIRLFSELPLEPNPLFTLYLDLRTAKLGDVQPYPEVRDEPGAASAALPEGASALLEVRGDRLVARALAPAAHDAGVVVDTWRNVLRDRPELIRSAIEGGTTVAGDDPFGQLSRALSTVGAFVHVPDGVDLPGPIVVRWSGVEPGRALLTRTLVSLGREAHASVLEEQVGGTTGAGQSLWTGTSEVILGQGATLDAAGEQNFAPDTVSFVNRHATLGQEATIRWALASLGGQLIRSRIDNRLEGRGSAVRQVEIGFGAGNQLFDLTSYTRHIGADTTSDLLSKGVFLDRSRGFIKGLIEIQRTARGSDSFLGEFAMLLTKKSRSVTIPSLEIDQPDVRRAMHSSSVGPIDEAQVFYLMSRGIPRWLARKYIVLAFLEPVVARIPLGEAQDRLRELLDAKWQPELQESAAA
jgi:Fe-S cluster assembly protein SufD